MQQGPRVRGEAALNTELMAGWAVSARGRTHGRWGHASRPHRAEPGLRHQHAPDKQRPWSVCMRHTFSDTPLHRSHLIPPVASLTSRDQDPRRETKLSRIPSVMAEQRAPSPGEPVPAPRWQLRGRAGVHALTKTPIPVRKRQYADTTLGPTSPT